MDYFRCQLYSVEMVGKKKSREEQVKEFIGVVDTKDDSGDGID